MRIRPPGESCRCSEEVGEIVDGRGAALHAHLGAVELERRIDVQRARDHESLSVIIGGADEGQAELYFASHRPGGVAGKNVDFPVLKRLKARVRRERRELDLLRIAKN